MRFKGISNLLLVVIIAASIVITLPVLSFASTQAVNDAAANTKLTNIYNRLGNMYDRMAATNAYLSNIQTYTQNTQTYLQYIYGQLGAHTGYSGDIFMQVVGVQDMVQAVGGQVADVSSKLLNTNNYLSSIDSKTIDRNYTQYIDQLEYNTEYITWNALTISSSGLYPTLNDALNETNALSPSYTYLREAYYRINFPSRLNFNGILRSDIPIMPHSQITFDDNLFADIYSVLSASNYQLIESNILVQYNDSESATTLLFEPIPYAYNNYANSIIIKVHTENSFFFFRNSSPACYYLNTNKDDYYTLSEHNLIKRLADIYASPDVVAAKQQQQAYEDQAITDFTGSGSAAASGSDTTNMKNVSGAIKSGLDSGGSVNGALSVFNTSGGLWDWFSQSNYDEINGTQSRSRGSEEYIDFYNTNREELERLLMEDNR